MKKILFHIVIILITLSTGCSKGNDPAIISPPSAPTNKPSDLWAKWQLITYTIKTDQMNYYFTGDGISSHAFRTLTFSRAGNYTADNNAWSGRYNYKTDNNNLVLIPSNAGLIPMTLTIDHFSSHQIQLSSPQVEVNPENPNASEYERFVAYQALSWLYNRNVNTAKLRTIKIQFAYSFIERDSTN